MKNIILTRESESNQFLENELKILGFNVISLPLIKRELNFSTSTFKNKIRSDRKLGFLLSSNFTLNFFLHKEIQALLRDRIISFYLLNEDLKTSLLKTYKNAQYFISAEKNGNSLAILSCESYSKEEKVIYVSAKETMGSVENGLNSYNVNFEKISVYETKEIIYSSVEFIRIFRNFKKASIAFFSQSAVNSYLAQESLIKDFINITDFFAIGESTARNLQNSGKEVYIPQKSDLNEFLLTIKAYKG